MPNNPPPNIFFSWSGKTSLTYAKAFVEFLPHVIQKSSIFFSPEKISKDEGWFSAIQKGLMTSETGIVFLTKENIASNWILFEAGGLFSKGRLCILLCDLRTEDLRKSDSIFQYQNVTKFEDKHDLLNMILTIKDTVSSWVEAEVIEKAFEYNYPFLRDRLVKEPESSNVPNQVSAGFERFAKKWRLSGSKPDSKYGEYPRIDRDGKYWLYDSGKEREVFYFELKILSVSEKSLVWQKFQTVDEKESLYLHSTEVLEIRDGHLIGNDTFGYGLNYQPNI